MSSLSNKLVCSSSRTIPFRQPADAPLVLIEPREELTQPVRQPFPAHGRRRAAPDERRGSPQPLCRASCNLK
jgi:hypothetical protein